MTANPSKVFSAEAKSLHDLYILEGGVAGFRIPLYQRLYNWDKENIQRLFEDVSSGLTWCSEDEDSLTFLGTVIVVNEDTDESYFDGQSLSVIDGQQRLTTISLLATVLYERLKSIDALFENLPDYLTDWIEKESSFVSTQLLDLIYGEIKVSGGERFHFPRIVREFLDNRGNNNQNSEYRSAAAAYLFSFANHVIQDNTTPFTFNQNGLEGIKELNQNVKYISNFISQIIENSSDFPGMLPNANNLTKGGIRKLFQKLPKDQDETNRIFSQVKEDSPNLISILRLLSFSHYLLNSVVTTIVKTREEKYAFDIFDSLNTTGEPLTAIETFKAQVIRFEKDQGTEFLGSKSEEYFKKIESYISSFSGSDKKQKETKELITSFALYITGERLGYSLDEQRRFLWTRFEKITGQYSVDNKRGFIKKISDISDYRSRFWLPKTLINQLSPEYNDRDILLGCLHFLYDLNSSLTIPILSRYFFASVENDQPEIFEKAVKAITAFVVLRRSATGSTASIDSDLRSLMLVGRRIKNQESTPLHCGLVNQNDLLSVEDLRSYLREWLAKSRIEILDKTTWVSKVINTSLYTSSKPLSRFLILSAFNNSRQKSERPQFLEKSRRSPETQFLNIQSWHDELFATVEHIAPESPDRGNLEWDPEIYSQPFIIHSLGNLTLLPQEENSSVANRNWATKKKIYSAFAATTQPEVDDIIKKSKADGFIFSKKNIDMLKKGSHLPFCKPLVEVVDWDLDFIKERSSNMAELAWDEISTWLF
ncbi:DUF262 domain-containing HNH endonuclease family protein [Fulvivirgaceae bacterium BMA12]|uniref:DUF262 domain-containing HNH endonuclease family protein n=1 Tax=Agaribacillus aureus TaxID=3051825 RepID=A0ABT8L6F2_9BACT|nr:DUF262 domain-containing HNH endonuclease family protein [Fulvivirgaceae bacterium BMA12]